MLLNLLTLAMQAMMLTSHMRTLRPCSSQCCSPLALCFTALHQSILSGLRPINLIALRLCDSPLELCMLDMIARSEPPALNTFQHPTPLLDLHHIN